jgi:hypothetical protein
MRGLLVLNYFPRTFGGACASGLVQFAENLHFGLGVLGATKCSKRFREQEMIAGLSRLRFDRSL